MHLVWLEALANLKPHEFQQGAADMELVKVVCERCGRESKAPKGCVWPSSCRYCTGDAAPRWWFRENNPDRKAAPK